MIVTGTKLNELVKSGLVDKKDAFDGFSVSLTLHERLVLVDPPCDAEIHYGDSIPAGWAKTQQLGDDGFLLKPHACVLACSTERVRMPASYFGLLQTKGSLARLFVSAHCSDGQVEPGYRGRITLEMCNHAPYSVRIRPGQPVAQLFVLEASTSTLLYNGRYQHAEEPTASRASTSKNGTPRSNGAEESRLRELKG